MKLKKAGLLTKLVVLVLLIATATALLASGAELASAIAERDALLQEKQELIMENNELSAAVENADDPDRIAAFAHENCGLVVPGEIDFIDAAAN